MTTIQKTFRVLVVDDDADHASSLAMLLGEHGYDAHVCLQPRECIDAVERIWPHVILLDLAMPGLTGYDIARALQGRPDLRPARLVAVTGYGQDLDRVQTQLCGFDYHLLKPVKFEQLEAIIKSVQFY